MTLYPWWHWKVLVVVVMMIDVASATRRKRLMAQARVAPKRIGLAGKLLIDVLVVD
jgi:hypothetical protein